jgi:hypothetical protein
MHACVYGHYADLIYVSIDVDLHVCMLICNLHMNLFPFHDLAFSLQVIIETCVEGIHILIQNYL